MPRNQVTVGEIVADLLKLPQDLPVLVGCHYDNDDGLQSLPGVTLSRAEQAEPAYGGAHFYTTTDDPQASTFAVIS